MLVGFPGVGAPPVKPGGEATSAEGSLETMPPEADGEVLADGRALPDEGGAAGEATAAGEALRLPACLPTKNAPTQIPMTQANPRIDSVRLLAGVIELT
jgi:hypothetical protein